VTEELRELLAAAKKATPSPAQREEQRRSFVYGNTAFENDLITRDMVDREAEKVKAVQVESPQEEHGGR